MKIVYANKKASHSYEIIDKLEAGIGLLGWEVKSIKQGKLNPRSSFVDYDGSGSLWLKGMKVYKWDSGPKVSEEMQNRSRRLLVKRTQAERLGGYAKRPGYTLIPLEIYVNDRGLIKVELALAKGKKKYQTKQKLKERDLERQMQRELKKYR